MPEIHLERATLPPSNADVDDINELLKQLARGVPRKTYGARVMQTITNAYLVIARDRSQRDPNILGKIVGMACLSVCPPLSGWYGIIDDVVVDRNGYLRQGIATQLIQKLIEEARKIELERIDLHSHPNRIPANAMYLRLGFELISQGDPNPEKDTSNQYRLRLS